MKLMRRCVICIFLFLFNSSVIQASCDADSIANMKLKAFNIEYTYDYIDNLYSEDFGMKIDNLFNVKLLGVSSDMYIMIDNAGVVYEYSNISNDTLELDKMFGGEEVDVIVYSKECGEKLRTFTISLPYYNVYSTNDECKNYSEAEFCSKFLTYEMTYEKFYDSIEQYKINDNIIDNENNSNENFFSSVLNSLIDNIVYIIVSLILVVSIVMIFMFYKKRRELN